MFNDDHVAFIQQMMNAKRSPVELIGIIDAIHNTFGAGMVFDDAAATAARFAEGSKMRDPASMTRISEAGLHAYNRLELIVKKWGGTE